MASPVFSATVAEYGAKPGELVDIVDADDVVIGRTSRVEAMKQGLRYRFVQVLVQNGQGDIWVHWRSRHKVVCPRQFGAVGGVVESGEDYATSAVRELQEELGVKDIPLVCIGTYGTEGNNPYNAGVFWGIYNGTQVSGWESEADAVEKLSRAEMDMLTQRFPYLFTDGLLKAWDMLKEYEAKEKQP